jgi:5-methylcytosine-specific restriction endonuclease McrA
VAAGSQGRFRLEPWSPGRYRVEFTASAELADKLERARELLSHALPSGDLAALIERAVDQLLEHETRRRYGSNQRGGRKRRPLTPGSRHVPVEVARQVWERDGGQCTFIDDEGRRCGARLFLTLEHRQPFALGGPATVDNLCLLCKSHNQHTAREVFGEEHITKKRVEREASGGKLLEKERPCEASGGKFLEKERPCEASGGKLLEKKRTEGEVYARVLCGLRNLGFRAKEAEAALGKLKSPGAPAIEEQLVREALSLLTP